MTDVFGVSFGWRASGTGVKVTPMTIQVAKLGDPAVRAFVTAVNAHDRAAFEAVLAPDATMSDDGADRDLADWTDREIFSSAATWRSTTSRRTAAVPS